MKGALATAIAALLLSVSPGAHSQETVSSTDPVIDSRERARDSYEAFLRLAPLDDPRRASALRRLADIEIERAERVQLEGDDLSAATAIYDRAIKLYQELLETYPDDPNNDAVTYQLARAFEQRGDVEIATERLADLVARYPESDFLIESFFRRGEAQFLAGDYDLAAEAYGAILARDDAATSTFYEQTLYKHGWSQFRLGEYELALDGFLVLLNHELAPGGTYDKAAHEQLKPGKQALLDDALRAMSISYSYLDGVEALNALLDRGSAPGFEFLLYQDLGDHFLEQERFSDAAGTFNAFVVDYPSDTHAPHLQLKVIDTYNAAGFAEQELAAREAFVDGYALTSTAGYWASHTRDEAPVIVDALKLNLTQLAEHYHSLSTSNAEAVDRAQRYYESWLASFPTDDEAPAQHFLLAELLYTHERYANATDAYEATAYNYGEHERAAEAGYASLLSYAAHQPRLPVTEQEAWQRRGINGALRFAGSFPQHPEANNVLVNAAERLFELAEFDRARSAALVLLEIDNPPAEADLRNTAWTVVGHSSFETGAFAAAENAYVQVLAMNVIEPTERTQMNERLAASVYKQAEARRDSGDLAGAVDDFLRVANVTPGSGIVATSQYDAAAALVQLEDWSRAATVLEGFRRDHGDHELATNVTRELAGVYLKAGRDVDAAIELDRIAGDSSYDDATRRNASSQAGTLYASANDVTRERNTLNYRMNALGTSLDETMDIRERLATLAMGEGDPFARNEQMRQIIAAHRASGGGSDRSRSAAASAAMTLADDELPAYMAMRLVVPLADALRAKKASMEALLGAYGDAADYGVGPVTTAATFRIAELYREMASALMDSERPPELTELELEEYEFLIEEQAFPFEEKAIEVYEANARRSTQGIYDDWVKKSFSELARLMPARYAKFEKGESFATLNP
ncbi:MAG: tol-pal system YbgF family protein [Gammaproteobacteria bacterium]